MAQPPAVVTPEALRDAVARRRRDQQIVVVLHESVIIDETEFMAANPGVTVRRTPLVRHPHQVFVFDTLELLATGMAVDTRDGFEIVRLPGSDVDG